MEGMNSPELAGRPRYGVILPGICHQHTQELLHMAGIGVN